MTQMPESPDEPQAPQPDAAVQAALAEIQTLLSRQRRVEDLVHRQDMPKHGLVEDLVHKQHLNELRARLATMAPTSIARILEALPQDESLMAWELISPERGEEILDELSETTREALIGTPTLAPPPIMLSAFELHNGRLRQVPVEKKEDLAAVNPIWVDFIAPTTREREWVEEIFDLKLPDLDDVTDLEESARFYIEDNGEVHMHSDFLLDKEDESRNVPVAFILHRNILFSVRNEELPVFRLQRMRARIQPGYVNDGKDVLLALYAADVEYSADALEDVYASLEAVGKKVLSLRISDAEAAALLADIAREEDLNGRIRRNVLDTRRALSFLLRSRVLNADQLDDARQILRDIESLDGHTAFIFGKINFLMDAIVGFININQNQRVSKLTTISVVFMPINIVAGIGGMSEFSMMTQGIPWPIAYGTFTVGMGMVGWITYVALRHFENRKIKRDLAARQQR